MSHDFQLIEDKISRAALDLLLKEPFYAHVFSAVSRAFTEEVQTMGLHWNGQQVVLRINPDWVQNKLSDKGCATSIKHEILHYVFRHLFRPAGRDPGIFSIAADLVVNQFIKPLPVPKQWPVLDSFPDLKLQADQSVDVYYEALSALHRRMKGAGNDEGSSSATGHQPLKISKSANALAKFLNSPANRHSDCGWHDGTDEIGSVAGHYAVESILLRARERTPSHQWDLLPDYLLTTLDLIQRNRKPQLDWRRILRLFCGSSQKTRIRHSIKRVSKRYGTRPGIKIQRLQRLLVVIDTSGSIDYEMLEAFFAEIHAAWKAGATVHILECDAEVHRDYPYSGRLPEDLQGGGGTDFEPAFRWMNEKRRFDGCLYLTDGLGDYPTTPPSCRLLWVITDHAAARGNNMPFGPSLILPIM
jgi:predicted metal-dependent peptidase